MKTKALSLGLLVALFAGSALLVAPAPAQARHDRHEWRHDHRGYGPPHGHARGHHKPMYVKKVVVMRPPVHRTVVVHEHHYHAYPPAYVYPAPVYSRDPAIVIGVSVPPIVIPLR
jgi:hypothetical protein